MRVVLLSLSFSICLAWESSSLFKSSSLTAARTKKDSRKKMKTQWKRTAAICFVFELEQLFAPFQGYLLRRLILLISFWIQSWVPSSWKKILVKTLPRNWRPLVQLVVERIYLFMSSNSRQHAYLLVVAIPDFLQVLLQS